jgi:hypothetical protein
MQVSIPVCRIALASEATPSFGEETQETLHATELLQVFWFPGKPAEDAIESQLLHRLASRGLLLEPFERAATGLREVYRAKDDKTT